MKEIIQKKIREWGWHANALQREQLHRVLQDLSALHTLPDLDLHYLPWTMAALRPAAVCALLNEITIHQRNRVLEFGAGLSTLYMADFYKTKGSGHIATVEHDEKWAAIVEEYLQKLNVPSEHCTVIHAPLVETDINGATNDWYDTGILSEALPDETFDMMFVDGPVSSSQKLRHARYPALPFAFGHLSDDCAVFLDDVGNDGVSQVAQRWKRKYGLNLSRIANMGVFRPDDTEATYDIL